MIEELCLMDLLEQEKDAVREYNNTISRIDYTIKYCEKSIRENPANKDFVKKYRDDDISKQKAKLEKAEMEIKNAREKIKEYFSRL